MHEDSFFLHSCISSTLIFLTFLIYIIQCQLRTTQTMSPHQHTLLSSRIQQLDIIMHKNVQLILQSNLQLINTQRTKQMGACQTCSDPSKQFLNKNEKYWNNFYRNGYPEQFQQLKDMFSAQLAKCFCLRKDQFCLSVQEGSGIVFRQGKSFYYGGIANQKAEGKGHIYYHKQLSYRGQFVDGLPEGKGKLYNVQREEQVLQDGNWSKGKMTNGEIIPGRNSIAIKITLIRPGYYDILSKGGLTYKGEGQIKENGQFYRDGKGVLEDKSNGIKYDGNWKQNKRQGYGQLTTKSGTFKGFFQNDKKLNGTFISSQNQQYIGIWQEGSRFTGSKKSGLRESIRIQNNEEIRGSLPMESRMN